MIHKISNFRIYAAIDYSTDQIYSMSYTIPSFPRNELFELVELSKQPINKNWEKCCEPSWNNKRNMIVKNTISGRFNGIGVYRLIQMEIENDQSNRFT